jgi:hypothetical protein
MGYHSQGCVIAYSGTYVVGNAITAYNWRFDVDGNLTVPGNITGVSIIEMQANNFFASIQSANEYPTLLAYGSSGHGGPELDWMNADDPANNFNSGNVYRNTMYLNGDGLFVGLDENRTGNITRSQIQLATDGNLYLGANLIVNPVGRIRSWSGLPNR